jgi:hypothetical protein
VEVERNKNLDSLFFLFTLITRKGLELLLGFTTSLAGGCHGEELGRWKYRGRIMVREGRSRGRGIYRRKKREREREKERSSKLKEGGSNQGRGGISGGDGDDMG